MKRPLNWWVRRCVSAYWDHRHPQLVRLEDYAKAYDADEHDYYERVEPRVTFKDTLIHQARELAAERAAEADGRGPLAWAI